MTLVLFKDKAGQWRWRLLAGNNKRLGGPQEGYWNQVDALSNAELVTDFTARGITLRYDL